MAKRTVDLVPSWPRGAPGIHRHAFHAPSVVASGSATAPATSAQYPHAAQPRTIDTTTETVRATMSFLETAENLIARLRSARCWTDRLVRKIVADIATVTGVIRGSP